MPQFDVTTFPTQIFWLLIFFTILMIYTIRVSVPRMRDLLDERWQKTDGYKLSAERSRKETHNLEQKRLEVINVARENASNLTNIELEKVILSQEKQKNDIHADVKVQLENHEKQMRSELSKIREDMDVHILETATEIVNRITGMAVKKSAVEKAKG